jgi:hypothetical protein
MVDCGCGTSKYFVLQRAMRSEWSDQALANRRVGISPCDSEPKRERQAESSQRSENYLSSQNQRRVMRAQLSCEQNVIGASVTRSKPRAGA